MVGKGKNQDCARAASLSTGPLCWAGEDIPRMYQQPGEPLSSSGWSRSCVCDVKMDGRIWSLIILGILWDNILIVWLVIITCWHLNTYAELEIFYSYFTARFAPYMYMSCLLVRIYSDWTSTPALWCNGRNSSGLGSYTTICLELCLETGTQQECTNWFSH